jgi:pSer/pThr/pTyr-binding forkhead associated (FHA) protein
MSYHPQQSGSADLHIGAAIAAVPVDQQTDAVGEIVQDDPTAGPKDASVDPLAQTDPPGQRKQADPSEIGEAVLEHAAEQTDPDAIEELDGAPTRVDAPPQPVEQSVPSVEPRLVVIGGPDRGREFILTEGESSLGRGLDNDIVLADIAVSRRHTTVSQLGAAFELRDLGSGNGTIVNGNRVDSHLLEDGDQIELGNSLLRFEAPVEHGSPLAEPAAVALGTAETQVGDGETQVGEIIEPDLRAPSVVPPPEAVATVAEMEAPRTATQPRRKGMRRSTKLLIFGSVGLVAFLGFMLALKVALDRRKAAKNRSSATIARPQNTTAAASEHFDRGREYLRSRQWSKARDEFEKVYGLAPRFEHAKRYIRQARSEIRAEEQLKKAKQALSDGAFDLARSSLAKVPPTSVYAAELPRLKQQIDETEVDRLMGQARSLREEGKDGALARARELAEKAVRIAPADAEVRALLEELGKADSSAVASANRRRGTGRRSKVAARGARRRGSGRSAATGASAATEPRGRGAAQAKRSQPRVTTKLRGQSRRVLKRALALYADMQWSDAAAMLEEQAKGESNESRKNLLEQRAKSIRRVGKAYQDALAIQTRNQRRAIRAYQQAITADQKASGGIHKQNFEQRLYKVARLHAITSLKTGRYDTAYRGLTLAKRYGTVDDQLKRVEESLERKASDLFTKGYTIRTRNAAEARRLWQRVLRMVSPESAVYQKAYKWLNNSAPAYLDEDEL